MPTPAGSFRTGEMSDIGHPPPKRRKVSLACLQCREKKIRCSGEKPVCASCRRRPGALPAECSYTIQSDVDSHVNESIRSLFERLQRLEEQSSSPLTKQEPLQSKSSSNRESGSPNKDYTHRENAFNMSDSGASAVKVNSSNEPHPAEAGQRVAQDATRLLHNPECWPLVNHSLDRLEGSLPRERRPSIQAEPPSTSSNVTQPMSNYSRRSTSSQYDNSEEYSRRQEKDSKILEPGATPATDAMGTASMGQEGSPEDTAQYYGGSSGIAFMRAISKVLSGTLDNNRQDINSSSTASTMSTGGRKQSGRLEPLSLIPKFEGPDPSNDFFTLPPRPVSDYLLENYWTRAYPLYPLIHRPTFEAAYAALWSPTIRDELLAQESDAGLGNNVDAGPSTQCFYCALNIMLALGSQFAEVSASRRKDLCAMFATRSKNLLVVDMMDKGNLAVVQALLLTGQFLQSTLNPQRCWNSIGIGCRIAQALGLHVEVGPGKTGVLELEMRRRVWYGCVMLDMMSSMTMGRPLMISHHYSTASPSLIDDEQLPTASVTASPNNLSKVGFFLEAIKLTQTLGIILTTLYDQSIGHSTDLPGLNGPGKSRDGPTSTDLKTVLELDKRLVRFQNELPPQLRWGEDGDRLRRSLGESVGYIEMQTNVLHARFLQARILLYRESFIQMCQDSRSKTESQQAADDRNLEFDLDAFYMTRCAASCIASARELLELLHRTTQTKNTDAWWYSIYATHNAGMVVKLAQLCNPMKQVVSTETLSESWALCRDILSRMTSWSPVAQRCLDSLEAIQEKISVWDSKKTRVRSNLPHIDGEDVSVPRNPNSDIDQPDSHHASSAQNIDRLDEPNPQVLGHSGYTVPSRDEMEPLNESYPTANTIGDETNWSTDLRYWWNFPGVDFDFEGLQQ